MRSVQADKLGHGDVTYVASPFDRDSEAICPGMQGLQQILKDASKGRIRKREQVRKVLDIVVNVKYIVGNIKFA